LADQKSFAFAQKYDDRGAQQYSVRIGGKAATIGRSIVVNAKGEALINGQVVGDGFISTGAPSSVSNNTGFIVKLDTRGNVAVAVKGVGVGTTAYDREENIYVAGILAGLPAMSGAFQPKHVVQGCRGTATVALPCSYQHIVKLNLDGTRVLYSTFVTGSFGAVPVALVVNDKGEAIVAGTTNSPDYPTTAGSLLPLYRASGRRKPRPTGRPPTALASLRVRQMRWPLRSPHRRAGRQAHLVHLPAAATV
jgi:hypothetical protein